MKIRPVEADLFHAGGRTDRQTDIYDKGNNPFSQLCDTRLKTIHMSLSLSFTTIFHHQLAPSSCKQSHFGYSHFLLLQTRLLSTTSGPQPCKALKIFAIFFSGCVFPTVEWDGWQFEETRTEIKIFLEDPQANRLFERLKSKWNYNVTMMIFFLCPAEHKLRTPCLSQILQLLTWLHHHMQKHYRTGFWSKR